jgi:pimeloyl-ACP methyl ester carboxylesterase
MDRCLSAKGCAPVTDYVLVHGAWGGGWAYDRLATELRTEGHRVLVAELSGLGLRRTGLNAAIDLSRHVADVVDQVAESGFDRFVLAGHSYGGMVITGVATKLGEQIDALVYIDAFLPQDGQSLWDITGDWEHEAYVRNQRETPGLVAPIFGTDDNRLTHHPLLTLLEPVRFTGAEAKVGKHHYIFATGYTPTPFAVFCENVENNPHWSVHRWASSHDVMSDQPDRLRELLLSC